jgi:polysaccharide biosynthesis/export protein
LPEHTALPDPSSRASEQQPSPTRHGSSTSLRELARVLVRRRRLGLIVLGGLLLLCLLYCLLAPNQYDATAKVALRQSPASTLEVQTTQSMGAVSLLAAPLELETLANVFRSERLAWRVITELKLYDAPGFRGRFAGKFPGFRADAPGAGAREWLLMRFKRQLLVEALPRTLVLQIRFRTRDPALSAAVVNGLIHAYEEDENESRLRATAEDSTWLRGQLKDLKAQMNANQARLSAFEQQHGILTAPATADGQKDQGGNNPMLVQLVELDRELVAATIDRIVSEAAFHAASDGDPEAVAETRQGPAEGDSNLETSLLGQIRTQRSGLEEEQAQLSTEHGPNFPRVVEIRKELEELDKQRQAADAKLVDRFRNAWQMAQERENKVRLSVEAMTAQDLKMDEAATQALVMMQEARTSGDLYARVEGKVEEAALNAGVHNSSISVFDFAREPAKPSAPDLFVYMAITFFVGLWVSVGCVLAVESMSVKSISSAGRGATTLLIMLVVAAGMANGQPPTPTTSGLPSGVAHPITTEDNRGRGIAEAEAQAANAAASAAQTPTGNAPSGLVESPMAGPIGPGDLLEISEFQTPGFKSVARVSAAGTVTLPMVEEVNLQGLDEQGAERKIEQVLIAKGMLLHPHVSVFVLGQAGQDVSVLGEVARPGVYPYTLHHRLLDLISAASGLSQSAGRLVNIFHRNDPQTPHPVVLDPGGTDTATDHNPELLPGDTVQVSREGLVYVIGDVVRPGGFPVDPAQGLTVVQALSLAWGTSQNAATGRALLIREQKGGRTTTTLNLGKMIHGQEPDQPVRDRDILFVPDSTAKNLWNKTLESAIQSVVGVSIYAAMVYSQRF